MKYFKILLLAVGVGLTSCSSDDLNSTSIFDTTSPTRNVFEKWLLDNYVTPYNISFNYKYSDKESDNTYNLVPADSAKSVALAIMMKHIWVDSYSELMGEGFLKSYSPRVMQLIGSPAYSNTEELVLGTAEGGLKITLYNVNAIDIDNPYIDSESPFVDETSGTKDLNFWYFHTMHHEFCHIMTQKKNYTTDFRLVSAGKYKTSDWINLADKNAPALGFVSGYASSEYNEDFAEIFSMYVTHSADAWKKLLDAGIVPKIDENGDTIKVIKDGVENVVYDYSGPDAIEKKLEYVKNYMATSWNLDLDKLRQIVLRRSGEVKTLDLKNLK